MRSRLTLIIATSLAAAGTPSTGWAQQGGNVPVEFGSSPNPVGSGARALGMASAFIATADDATAASWNPGSLIVLEAPEASLVLSYKDRRQRFAGLGVAPEDEIQSTSYGDLNYFSLAYPFKVGSRYFVAALNYQALIDFDTDQRKSYFTQVDGGPGVPSLLAESDVYYRQHGSLRALSPALAFQLSPTLSVGATLNISTSKLGFQNGWREVESIRRDVLIGANTVTTTFEQRERNDYNGVGAVAGVLWDFAPQWSLGAVVKTPTWGTLTREILRSERNGQPFTELQSLEESYRLPPSYGVGVAYRHSDALTISGDIYRTEWSYFRHAQTDLVSGATVVRNPINARAYDDSGVSGITQAHLGAEYLFVFPRTVVPIRGGLFYDPEPADRRLNHFYGLALGTGVSIWNDVVIDLAYQVRFSTAAQTDLVRVDGQADPSTASPRAGAVTQNQLYLSVIYHLE